MFWVINTKFKLGAPTCNVRLDSNKNVKTNYRHQLEFLENLQKSLQDHEK